MKKVFIISLAFILNVIVSVYGEIRYTKTLQPDHLMFHTTPAMSLLRYQSIEAASQPAPTIGLGMEYAHFFHQNFGLSAGVEINSYAAFYTFEGRKDSLLMFDSWSSYHYKLRQQLHTKEHQQVNYLSFPVKIVLRQALSRTVNFNLSSGIAYNIYMFETKNIVSGAIYRQAYFDDIYVNIDEYYPLLFGRFPDYIQPSPINQFSKTLTVIAQAGLSIKIKPQWMLHTEINFQNGLKNIKTRNIDLLVPQEYAGVTATNFIGDIKPYSLGLRIGLTYNFDWFGKDCKCHGNWWE